MPFVSQQLADSRVIRFIDGLTPVPVKATMAQLRSAVIGDGIPTLIEGIGQGQQVPVPDASTDTPALNRAAESVLKIAGTAYQCGQNQTGTGFVVSPGRVVTNAHVVAGVSQPVVEIPGGGAMPGRVVYFDTQHDLAVLAVDGLPSEPLALSSDLPAGSPAAFAGYPHGGPFQSKPATVQDIATVLVPDIYGNNPSPEDVYRLAGDVQPGNSGGPLLTTDGQVAGVIFAKATTRSSLGFAITMSGPGPGGGPGSGLAAPSPRGSASRSKASDSRPASSGRRAEPLQALAVRAGDGRRTAVLQQQEPAAEPGVTISGTTLEPSAWAITVWPSLESQWHPRFAPRSDGAPEPGPAAASRYAMTALWKTTRVASAGACAARSSSCSFRSPATSSGGSSWAIATAWRSRSRRNSCSGQTSASSQATSSGSRTSRGLGRSLPATPHGGVRRQRHRARGDASTSEPGRAASGAGRSQPRDRLRVRRDVLVAVPVREQCQPGRGAHLEEGQRLARRRRKSARATAGGWRSARPRWSAWTATARFSDLVPVFVQEGPEVRGTG